MSRPRLLDLFCKAGGASKGYMDAGFLVVGVDIEPQPNYCGHAFYRADALEFVREHGHEFDVIAASPPCQRYSKTAALHRHKESHRQRHPDLVDPTREALRRVGKPYVIENVVGAPLLNPTVLCGTMFNLRVYRHRLFESSVPLPPPPAHPKHKSSTGSHRGYSTFSSGGGMICVAGNNFVREEAAAAMDIDWMKNRKELAQAIPPAYTRWIGEQMMRTLFPNRNLP